MCCLASWSSILLVLAYSEESLSKASSNIVFSLNESNFGSIWLEFPEMIEINGEEIERLYLENSLISFLSKLKRGIFEDRIENYLPLEKKLYKNWGEDFWRVRKDKDKT